MANSRPTHRLAPVSSLSAETPKARGQWANVVAQLRKNPGAKGGGIVLVALGVIALIAPLVAPFDPIQQGVGAPLAGPSFDHLMGTDQFGRDVFSRVLLGARISLRIGFISIGIAAVIGLVLGLIAGYYEGKLEKVIVALIDVMLAFPGILLAVAVVAVLGPSLTNAMIAVGIAQIPTFTRMVRGSVLSEKHNIYIESARVAGCSDSRLLLRHLLPNVISPIIILATLGLGLAILSGSALTFIGLGAQPPTPEWGAILVGGRSFLRVAPWITTFPGLAIMISVVAVNLVGDGLREALEPRLRA